MAIGVVSVAETAEAAEESILKEHPELTMLRTKRIDVSDLRSRHGLTAFPPDAWVVVVEYPDPENAPMPPQDDPEAETEAIYRRDMRNTIDLLLRGRQT